MKTTTLYIPADPGNPDPDYHVDMVIGVRPQRWTDKQWSDLVQRNKDYYGPTIELKQREWEYGG